MRGPLVSYSRVCGEVLTGGEWIGSMTRLVAQPKAGCPPRSRCVLHHDDPESDSWKSRVVASPNEGQQEDHTRNPRCGPPDNGRAGVSAVAYLASFVSTSVLTGCRSIWSPRRRPLKVNRRGESRTPGPIRHDQCLRAQSCLRYGMLIGGKTSNSDKCRPNQSRRRRPFKANRRSKSRTPDRPATVSWIQGLAASGTACRQVVIMVMDAV